MGGLCPENWTGKRLTRRRRTCGSRRSEWAVSANNIQTFFMGGRRVILAADFRGGGGQARSTVGGRGVDLQVGEIRTSGSGQSHAGGAF